MSFLFFANLPKFGRQFCAPKRDYQSQEQPVLSLENILDSNNCKNFIFDFRNFFEIYTTILFVQVDSPELLDTPEITEMMENFIKVTKYLTKLKETLINYVWEKSLVKKQEE